MSRPSSSASAFELSERLGYLLKRAHVRFSETVDAELGPLGIDGREWVTLALLDNAAPSSQHDIAGRLGVDRTTMVAVVDALEDKGLVTRRRDPTDRRRNVVELTPEGRSAVRLASRAVHDAERAFLAPISIGDAATLRSVLARLAVPAASD